MGASDGHAASVVKRPADAWRRGARCAWTSGGAVGRPEQTAPAGPLLVAHTLHRGEAIGYGVTAPFERFHFARIFPYVPSLIMLFSAACTPWPSGVSGALVQSSTPHGTLMPSSAGWSTWPTSWN